MNQLINKYPTLLFSELILKRAAFLALIFFSHFLCGQQLQVQAIKPNPYFIKSEDIFNIQVVNPTSSSIDVKFKGVWFYQGQKGVELQSENAVLQPGVNVFSAGNPGVTSKTYFIKAIDEVETSTGTLPAGKYRACIYIACIKPDCNGAGSNVVLSETDPCYEFNVEQPTPLLLNSQPNGNISNEHRPAFTWIPPMPLGANPDLKYTLTLVRKNSVKQGCTDAVLRNRPLLKEDNISGTLLNYPGDVDELDTGDYAWQVNAVYDGYTVATSEAWCFKVEEKKKKKDTLMYVELKRRMDASFINYAKDDLFCFIFNGTYQNVKLDCRIYNEQTNTEILPLPEKREESAVKEEFVVLHSFGENKYAINLADYNLLPGQYMVKIKDNLGILYYQRIIIK